MNYKSKNKTYIYYIFGGAFLLRCLFALFSNGFLTDVSCFYAWAYRVFHLGFSEFYSPDVFTDYPPGYMYVLYLLGALLKNRPFDSGETLLILKFPAILCDMGAGLLIYKIAQKYHKGNSALFFVAFYLFNPAIFINSSIWGQVDSVFTFALLITCLLLTEGKTIPAYYVFAIGILLKPQMLVFTPLVLMGFLEYVFLRNFQIKKFILNVINGLMAIGLIFLFSLPFGIEKVINQYITTLASYPYISVNAYNFWSLFGLNWSPQDKPFLFTTYAALGTFIIILLTFLSVFIFLSKRNFKERYYLTGSFLIITMFLFSVRMHERYIFPGLLLLLMTCIMSNQKRWLHCYYFFSFAHFLNAWHVLNYYDPAAYDPQSIGIIGVSFLMVVSGAFYYYTIIRDLKNKLPAESVQIKLTSSTSSNSFVKKNLLSPKKIVASRPPLPFTKADGFIMLGITVLYTCFAFWNLGITQTPQTEMDIPYSASIDIISEDGRPISTLNWYLLNEQDIDFSMEIKESSVSEWSYLQDFTMSSVFSWASLQLPNPVYGIRITNIKEDAHVGEIVIQDSAGQILPVQNAMLSSPLYDEAETFPSTINHLTGCYFDEIYYTRTAYEFINGLPTYENTHPPFGKVLISWGASLFGTTPFGFRFMGTLFGVLMLPFMYLLGRNITRNRGIGAFICFIFAFDFMHFVQTRITTIDVFVTFFIILMYYFMERYIHLSFYDTPLVKTWIPLGACGIAFGFGVASKWTGAYAGAGLAVIFFTQLLTRYREYQYARLSPKKQTENIEHKTIIATFKNNTTKTIGFCMIFFVLIPFIIYLLSYIPFVDSYRPGLLDKMIQNQKTMFSYHSNLDATHPYSSSWYEWPTIKRPIFYYSNVLEGSLRQGISSFGNPLVWWLGIPAFFYTLYVAIKKNKKSAGFLCLAFLAQFLPWTLISRCTFIYHFFPSVPFFALMIGYSLMSLKEEYKIKPKIFYGILIIFALAVFLLFLLFYPVLSGTPVHAEYVKNYLRWFDSWVLTLS